MSGNPAKRPFTLFDYGFGRQPKLIRSEVPEPHPVGSNATGSSCQSILSDAMDSGDLGRTISHSQEQEPMTENLNKDDEYAGDQESVDEVPVLSDSQEDTIANDIEEDEDRSNDLEEDPAFSDSQDDEEVPSDSEEDTNRSSNWEEEEIISDPEAEVNWDSESEEADGTISDPREDVEVISDAKESQEFTCGQADVPSTGTEPTEEGDVQQLAVASSSQNIHAAVQLATGTRNDIAMFIGKTFLTDGDKHTILQELWTPDIEFKFPQRIITSSRRSFQLSWMTTYQWLAYSRIKDAAFCKFCFVFKFQRESEGGSGGVQNSHLVSGGFTNWKKATTAFKEHVGTKFHKECTNDSASFLKSYLTGVDESRALFRKKVSKEAAANKEILSTIIRIVILLGRQNIPFRGHRDSGGIDLNKLDKFNEGNFRALVKYVAQNHDKHLAKHFTDGPGNARYISPDIQNQIIDICGNIILKKLVDLINEAKCFAVIADETTDLSTTEQLTICVRHVQMDDNGKYFIREDFLGFEAVTDLSGNGLAKTILKRLQEVGLDMDKLRGQSYDGAAAMSSEVKGVKAMVIAEHPLAVYTYCSNHCLNLVVSSACGNKHVRNMIGIVKETVAFFARSPKRTDAMRKYIKKLNRGDKVKDLLGLCETRWVERHDALIRFADLFECVQHILENIEDVSKDRETITKANILLKSICSLDFLLALHTAIRLLSLTHSISKILQDPQADLQVCYEQINTAVSIMKEIQENSETEFHDIFNRVTSICAMLEIEVKMPRLCKRQALRDNVVDLYGCGNSAEDVETYFRRTMFNPFVEELIDQLTSRFENHESNVCVLLRLLPRHVKTCGKQDLESVFDFYKIDLNVPFELFYGEFSTWSDRWNKCKRSTLPTTALETLQCCNKSVYPSIHRLIKILCTFPISVATAERTFSSLRRLKTYLRSSMTEDRLSALAMMHIHTELEIDIDVVLAEFKRSNRKLVLP